MKKLNWRITLLFALAFILTLLVTAPAAILSGVVSAASKGQFALANADGSIWRGSAVPAIRQHNGNLLVLEKLNWEIAFLPLLTGKLAVQLRWDHVEQARPMVVTASYSQVELRDAVLPLYAGLFGELVPLMKPVQLNGPLLVRSPLFTLTRQGMNGSATAVWSNASSVLSPVRPLGQYQISLAGSGNKLEIGLRTESGMLLLDGSGSFAPAEGLRFHGTAKAAAESKGRLDELLGNFGPEVEPGVHMLNVMR